MSGKEASTDLPRNTAPVSSLRATLSSRTPTKPTPTKSGRPQSPRTPPRPRTTTTSSPSSPRRPSVNAASPSTPIRQGVAARSTIAQRSASPRTPSAPSPARPVPKLNGLGKERSLRRPLVSPRQAPGPARSPRRAALASPQKPSQPSPRKAGTTRQARPTSLSLTEKPSTTSPRTRPTSFSLSSSTHAGTGTPASPRRSLASPRRGISDSPTRLTAHSPRTTAALPRRTTPVSPRASVSKPSPSRLTSPAPPTSPGSTSPRSRLSPTRQSPRSSAHAQRASVGPRTLGAAVSPRGPSTSPRGGGISPRSTVPRTTGPRTTGPRTTGPRNQEPSSRPRRPLQGLNPTFSSRGRGQDPSRGHSTQQTPPPDETDEPANMTVDPIVSQKLDTAGERDGEDGLTGEGEPEGEVGENQGESSANPGAEAGRDAEIEAAPGIELDASWLPTDATTPLDVADPDAPSPSGPDPEPEEKQDEYGARRDAILGQNKPRSPSPPPATMTPTPTRQESDSSPQPPRFESPPAPNHSVEYPAMPIPAPSTTSADGEEPLTPRRSAKRGIRNLYQSVIDKRKKPGSPQSPHTPLISRLKGKVSPVPARARNLPPASPPGLRRALPRDPARASGEEEDALAQEDAAGMEETSSEDEDLAEEEIYMRNITDPVLQRVFGRDSVMVTSSRSLVPFIMVPTEPEWQVPADIEEEDSDEEGLPALMEEDAENVPFLQSRFAPQDPRHSTPMFQITPPMEIPFILITPEDIADMKQAESAEADEDKPNVVRYRTSLSALRRKSRRRSSRLVRKQSNQGDTVLEVPTMEPNPATAVLQDSEEEGTGLTPRPLKGMEEGDGSSEDPCEAPAAAPETSEKRQSQDFMLLFRRFTSVGLDKATPPEPKPKDPTVLNAEEIAVAKSMFQQTGRAVYLQLADKLAGLATRPLEFYETQPIFLEHPLNSQMSKVRQVITQILSTTCQAAGCDKDALIPYDFCGGRYVCTVCGPQGESPLKDAFARRRRSTGSNSSAASPPRVRKGHRRSSSLYLKQLLEYKGGMAPPAEAGSAAPPSHRRAFSLADVLRSKHSSQSNGMEGEERKQQHRALLQRHQSLVSTATHIMLKPKLYEQRERRERSLFESAMTIVQTVQTVQAVQAHSPSIRLVAKLVSPQPKPEDALAE